MELWIHNWVSNPIFRRFLIGLAGLVGLYVLVRIGQRWIRQHVRHPDTRYRLRKIFTFCGYTIGIVYLAGVFSDRLRQLRVVLG